ncbi:MAG: TorF family putative porin [Novosphingobium sp.]
MLTSIRGLVAATLLTGCAFAATPALADDTDPPEEFTVSGSATIVSQYRFRGISQSDNKPAVQGAITLSHKSGFYISTWGSSTAGDFTFANSPIQPGGTEIDVYGGYSHTFDSAGVTVDVGAYGYIYPNAPIGNYYEIYGSVAKTFGPATAKVGIYYAPGQNVFKALGVTDHNAYVYGDLSSGIPGTPITLHGHIGYTDGGLAYGKNYLDYSVGASVSWKMLTLDASLVGTNVSKSDVNTIFGCVPGSPCETYWHRPAKTVGVVSLTASF